MRKLLSEQMGTVSLEIICATLALFALGFLLMRARRSPRGIVADSPALYHHWHIFTVLGGGSGADPHPPSGWAMENATQSYTIHASMLAGAGSKHPDAANPGNRRRNLAGIRPTLL